MEISSRPDERFAPLYPDVMEHGSLLALLNDVAQRMGFALRCEESVFKGRSATVRGTNGKSQIHLGAKQRAFSFDFWQKGVILANGSTDSPQKMMVALHELLEKGTSPFALGNDFSFAEPSENAASYYRGAAFQVQEQWDRLEERAKDKRSFLKDSVSVIKLARQHPQLGQLFPFSSHWTLRFSCCTGYPFDVPCSGILALENNDSEQRFAVTIDHHAPQCEPFKGNASEVIEFVAAQLPPDCGPARQGTAEDDI